MKRLQIYQHTKILLNKHYSCTSHQINMFKINILDLASGQNNQSCSGIILQCEVPATSADVREK